MRRIPAVLFVLAATMAVGPPPASGGEAPSTRSVVIGGTEVSTYPEFDPATTRYAVDTSANTAGTLTVTATTSDPDGTITVDGRPADSGDAVTVDGLAEGDEVAVGIDDDGGASTYAFVYLPPTFPQLTVTTAGEGPEDGSTFLTLNRFAAPPFFETAVDRNGVPVFVNAVAAGSQDFKATPAGGYSVARQTTTPGRTGYAIHQLDAAFEEVAAFETLAPQIDTDSHDSVLRPDGSRLLIAYQDDAHPDPVIDAVIQEIAPDGTLAFEWDSEDHIPEADGLVGAGDYAHVNSMEYTPDGDILASFRNTSQVLLIARTAHDGHDAGDVIWRLGGEHGDFTFVDDPEGGFCAQHTAHLFPDGRLLVWDNGAVAGPNVQTGNICPDPENPGGRHGRPFSRAAEYQLDLDDMTATLVWTAERDGGYTQFAGGAQRLPGGHTMLGWVDGTPIATEVDESGDEVWSLSVDGGYTSYRSRKYETPDAVHPEVDLATPADGATVLLGQAVEADFGCTDRGGSNLATCDGPAAPGEALDTSTPGPHEFTVTATDGEGNQTEVTHTYDVVTGAHQPDGVIRRQARGPWIGNAGYDSDGAGQTVVLNGRPGRTLTALVRFQDDGTDADRFTVRGSRNSAAFQVRWFRGSVDVSAAVKAGTYTTPEIGPGGYHALRVEMTVKRAAAPGAQQRVRVTATSTADPSRADTVVAVARALA
jgi:hypothetical protein